MTLDPCPLSWRLTRQSCADQRISVIKAGLSEGDESTPVARLLAQLPFGTLLLGIMRGMLPKLLRFTL